MSKAVIEDEEFHKIIDEIINNDMVQEMKNYRQHYNTSCFEHCYWVAYYCYRICKKLKLDYKSAARAGMVHDLFLYDWREPSKTHTFHAFTHGRVACKNAEKIIDLNLIEKDIIKNHMFPITPILPKYKETWIITLVDKFCALRETRIGFQRKFAKSKAYRLAMIIVCFFIFRK